VLNFDNDYYIFINQSHLHPPKEFICLRPFAFCFCATKREEASSSYLLLPYAEYLSKSSISSSNGLILQFSAFSFH